VANARRTQQRGATGHGNGFSFSADRQSPRALTDGELAGKLQYDPAPAAGVALPLDTAIIWFGHIAG